jgi:serine/threonine-protein kinase
MRNSLERLRTSLADRYAIERELGRGGMATVYLARDLKLDRPVAVKVLLEELGMALGPDRFRREITIASQLSHPHILPVDDSGDADGQLYCVMPFVSGETLRARLDREGQLGVDEALRITGEIAGALEHAHQHGIVHRDIKPENILLENGQVLVADFGIARALSAMGEEKLTKTGVSLGTPAYMSPEQAMADPALDSRSDIYSLGCVLYEMLAGSQPFTGPTAQAIIARHALAEVPSLTIVRETIPDEVEDAVLRAMAKVPADRFATAAEFARALRACHGTEGRSLGRSERRARTRAPAQPKAANRRVVAVGAAVGVIALAGIGLVAWLLTG